ncbi:transposase [Burkholderia lata]|uniref:transposase n=1 Tax=Burkholderia lata (strain ATCC 17760 / DSM 23089 / LMG 22485 / NCIMB 9086 / R18194 / 383) TaxID=482957 RepID=UPI0015831143|nr:transposase [Burkholderia lata]
MIDAAIDGVREWRHRPRRRRAWWRVMRWTARKVRDEGAVRDRAIRQALGVCRDGSRDGGGRSIEQAEEVKCRLRVVNHPVPNNKQDF